MRAVAEIKITYINILRNIEEEKSIVERKPLQPHLLQPYNLKKVTFFMKPSLQFLTLLR